MTETNRIALVTGASRGLGRAIALELARAGRHVYALARTEGALDELHEEMEAAALPRPTLLPMDITDDDAVERLGKALLDRHGRLDDWVHTAAFAPALAPAGQISKRNLDRSLATNARAVARLIGALDPALMQSGRGIAVAFPDAQAGAAFWSPYHAPKAAGIDFLKSWAAERQSAALQVIFHQAPPMPTKLRERFLPGEDQAGLKSCESVAKDVLRLMDKAIA